ncbi:hypothetical protein AK08_12135 [Listeria monocytogenes]|nr:hypothetical protein [Listeria monocytogenes]
MKKYRFSELNINIGTVLLIIMISFTFITFIIIGMTLPVPWEYFVILFVIALMFSVFFKRLFPSNFSVSEEAFYYKEKAYPYSEYLIECDAKLIRFNGGSRGMPYYRIVIINKDTRAEKLIRVYNAECRYKNANKHMQELMEELRNEINQYQA